MSAYLDHAATTPMRASARAAWVEQSERVGNPSSLHTSGRAGRAVVEESREQIAGALGARPSEVVFTSGGTEADNLAVKGIFWSRHLADPRRTRVLSTSVEHHAVLDALQWLRAHAGAEVELVAVDREGIWRGVDEQGVVFRDFEEQPAKLPAVTMRASTSVEALSEAAQVVGALPSDILRRVQGLEVGSVDRIVLDLRNGDQVNWGSSDDAEDK